MKKVSIGFDIGVSSVGWSIVDIDEKEVIDKGVKLFNQSKKAEDRRNFRSLRRRYNRKKHRLERLERLLRKNLGEIKSKRTTDNFLLEKRNKGLSEKIEEQDLVNILYFLLTYRGYQPFGEDTRDNPYTKEGTKNYKEEYKELLPCQLQKVILSEQGHYRGLEYPFLINCFLKEMKAILKEQSKFYDFITDKFIKEIEEIYTSRRKFWEGPGGARKDQLTPFGRYKNSKDLEQYKKNKDYNKYLYEELIGDCSIYVGQKAVPIGNYYAQEFNFLNDMINLRIRDEDVLYGYKNKVIKALRRNDEETYQLRLETIEEIKKEILNSKTIKFEKIFKNVLGIDCKKLIGARIDKEGKTELSKFEYVRRAKNKLSKSASNFKIENNIELWNKIVYIVAVSPNNIVKDQLHSKLKEEVKAKKITEKDIEILSDIKIYEQRYHSFSEKALKKYIDLMKENLFNSSKTGREFKEEIGSDVEEKKLIEYFSKNNNINEETKIIKMRKGLINNLVASPQVKKGLRQSIHIFNEIQKYCYEKYKIEYIVVESTRECLSEKQKKELNKFQLKKEKSNKEAKEKGFTGKDVFKYILLIETGRKCIYCDRNIDMKTIENEHILPISNSADNSQDNRIASCHDCNQKKGNKTPYYYLQSSSEWENYENRVKNNQNLSAEKKRNLLYTGNINKYDHKFINRNLRDTAYTTNEFIVQLDIYKKALKKNYEKELDFQVMSMPPKITSLVRKRIPKDRSKKYHHAVDATIAAAYITTGIGKKSCKLQNDGSIYFQDKEFVKKLKEELSILENVTYSSKIMESLKNTDYSNTRFLFDVKKSTNGQLANEKISKVIIKNDGQDKKYWKIDKFDIYTSVTEKGMKDLGKDMFENKNKLFAIKEKDPKTYEFLKKIYDDKKNEKWRSENGEEKIINPFIHYCCEQHELKNPEEFKPSLHGIRPISKKGKIRPVIKYLRYGSKVTNPYLFNKKNVHKKKKNHLMLDSLDTSYTEVYKKIDKTGYVFLPIYKMFMNLKSGKVDRNNFYYKQLYERLIGNEKVEKKFDVYANQYLRMVKKKDNKKYEGRFSSYDKTNMRLSFKNGKYFTKFDLDVEIVPIYGLGIYNVQIDQEEKNELENNFIKTF